MPDLAETCKCGHQVVLCGLVSRCEGCREACAMCDCPTPPDTSVPDSREPILRPSEVSCWPSTTWAFSSLHPSHIGCPARR